MVYNLVHLDLFMVAGTFGFVWGSWIHLWLIEGLIWILDVRSTSISTFDTGDV
jgi:hypothetical protein